MERRFIALNCDLIHPTLRPFAPSPFRLIAPSIPLSLTPVAKYTPSVIKIATPFESISIPLLNYLISTRSSLVWLYLQTVKIKCVPEILSNNLNLSDCLF